MKKLLLVGISCVVCALLSMSCGKDEEKTYTFSINDSMCTTGETFVLPEGKQKDGCTFMYYLLSGVRHLPGEQIQASSYKFDRTFKSVYGYLMKLERESSVEIDTVVCGEQYTLPVTELPEDFFKSNVWMFSDTLLYRENQKVTPSSNMSFSAKAVGKIVQADSLRSFLGEMIAMKHYDLTEINLEVTDKTTGYQLWGITWYYNEDSWFGEKYSFKDYGVYDSLKLKINILPNSELTKINAALFACCGGLYDISLPSGIKGIGANAFYNCYNLTKVSIPEGVTTIGDYAFKGCINVSEFNFPTTLSVLGIGTLSLYHNDKKKSNSVLEHLVFHENLNFISHWNFHAMTALKSITFEGKVETFQSLCLNEYVPDDYIIYVPAEYLDYYKESFKSYTSHFQAIEE